MAEVAVALQVMQRRRPRLLKHVLLAIVLTHPVVMATSVMTHIVVMATGVMTHVVVMATSLMTHPVIMATGVSAMEVWRRGGGVGVVEGVEGGEGRRGGDVTRGDVEVEKFVVVFFCGQGRGGENKLIDENRLVYLRYIKISTV